MVLLGCLLGAAQLFRFAAPRFAVDDAWISFRVARNLLRHGVLTFDVTLPAVEGMTNLLWTLLSTAWIGLFPGVDPIVPARMVGAVLYVATIAAAVRLAARMARDADGTVIAAAVAAALLFVSSGSMAFYALSGLETPLWGLLLVLTIERLDAALRGRRHAGSVAGVLLGLLAICRPEGVAIGLTVCLWLLANRDRKDRLLHVAVPFVLIVMVLETFRLVAYGSLVPNTYFAKPPYPSSGLAYLLLFLLVGTGGFGLLAAIPALRRVASARLVGWILLVGGVGTVWSGGDWMPGYRRFTVAFICLALLAATGVGLAWRRVRWPVLAAAACIVGGNLVGAVLGLDNAAYNTHVLADLGRLANESSGVRQVALTDIGRFGWHFEGSIFDLVGLTDRHIARLPGGHGKKTWDEEYFRRRAPDLVFVQNDRPLDDFARVRYHTRSSEGPVLHSLLTGGGYVYRTSVPLAEDVHLIVFARERIPLSEERWGPPAELEDWGLFEVEPPD